MLRSISDDDECSECARCEYDPGRESGCIRNWPGQVAPAGHPREGYVISCVDFLPVAKAGDNFVPQ